MISQTRNAERDEPHKAAVFFIADAVIDVWPNMVWLFGLKVVEAKVAQNETTTSTDSGN